MLHCTQTMSIGINSRNNDNKVISMQQNSNCRAFLRLQYTQTMPMENSCTSSNTENLPTDVGVSPIYTSAKRIPTTKQTTIATPVNKILPGMPSRQNIRKKARQTNAEPVSRCSTINAMGSRMIASVAAKCFHWLMLQPYVDMNFDNASAVANLANSAGCKRSGPNTSHDLEPLMECGLKIVAKSKTSSKPYMTKEKVSQKRSSSIRMTKPSIILVAIQIICIPERVSRLKISVSPYEQLAPQTLIQPNERRAT